MVPPLQAPQVFGADGQDLVLLLLREAHQLRRLHPPPRDVVAPAAPVRHKERGARVKAISDTSSCTRICDVPAELLLDESHQLGDDTIGPGFEASWDRDSAMGVSCNQIWHGGTWLCDGRARQHLSTDGDTNLDAWLPSMRSTLLCTVFTVSTRLDMCFSVSGGAVLPAMSAPDPFSSRYLTSRARSSATCTRSAQGVRHAVSRRLAAVTGAEQMPRRLQVQLLWPHQSCRRWERCVVAQSRRARTVAWYVLLSDSTSLTDVSASSVPASSTTRPEPVFMYAGCAACGACDDSDIVVRLRRSSRRHVLVQDGQRVWITAAETLVKKQ